MTAHECGSETPDRERTRPASGAHRATPCGSADRRELAQPEASDGISRADARSRALGMAALVLQVALVVSACSPGSIHGGR